MSDALPAPDLAETPLEHRAHHLAGAIYGTILATTVVAASAYDPEKVSKALVIVAVTSAVFWLAHAYALSVAARMVAGRPLRRREMRTIAVSEWPMLQSSWPILAALALGAFDVIDRDTAIDLAMAVGIGALFTYGFVLSLQEHLTWPRVVLNSCVTGGFGLAILALKVFVH